jgi:hypothetical protein
VDQASKFDAVRYGETTGAPEVVVDVCVYVSHGCAISVSRHEARVIEDVDVRVAVQCP